MRKQFMPKYKGLGDRDTPVWTRQMQTRSVSVSSLPTALQAKLKANGRGPQKTPTKVKVSIRLSPDVLEALRASGDGWQSRVDDALRTLINLTTKRV
jgi:uncharacterized protein (DUF4415 family)